ncbi:translation initiation factor IF3 [Rhizoctonia solani AG-3 Rhs1AP]|uniref:Altered inheritance of mitochondria protein 23, mitochondrial n=2 Tax=Rhizoctonia solani AG-3 TaxID=1086053 RepID=A0A074SH94_9AGAM|nr:translation initiation factor IF3 [Rhizoctonia solani AG-3 Rhs1AP]KEP49392.1 translation initiation factor IF3 [Rhizoctonia solani 123E]
MTTRIAYTIRLATRVYHPAASPSLTRAGPSRIIASCYECRRFESHSAALKRAEAARERAVQNPAFFKNNAIPYTYVRLVNSETNRLEPETKLKDLLASIDLDVNYLQLVSTDPPDGGKPLVKIINKHDAAQKEREQKAKKKEQKKGASGKESKEIQLSWNVEPGDLKHKLSKVIKELEKKNRVTISFIPKKGAAVPTRPQMAAKMDMIWDEVKHVATEHRPRTAADLSGLMYLQGVGIKEEQT